ncbi:BZ3500_MvSof-1268-A1-R1_Chr2-2g04785 [Microbotryum saponariae]|uniref:BZ3500_MvSof-1268-A1-R1_Chr2-2g04785 protein n=1 Tax=Microbotryum saponariae TaxID=289078 RepID=A0A2X0K4I9_9BASI|nr:BZ3500_MvSof-1268-A1-R1_Chr2-2g04785 [Microbotryum saponariae]SDA00161.1 BZ3501_MvSof-1269-A2-R1_Chr2-2g04459 [Microbotryum saponariae]
MYTSRSHLGAGSSPARALPLSCPARPSSLSLLSCRAPCTSLNRNRSALPQCLYKLMTKVLVARLNKVLPSVFPPSQHGFMLGRKASDAGSHLSLLLKQICSLDLADSALLSLDQESAYDLVDHDWIMSVFQAMGAPERFLGLLNVIYRSVSLRYIINGYLTEAVRMLCGLGQGDPVSCPIWNVCFQPYLDALVRKKLPLISEQYFIPPELESSPTSPLRTMQSCTSPSRHRQHSIS